jgi:hypothetical protein
MSIAGNWAGDFDLYSGTTLNVISTVNIAGAFAKLGGGNCNITMNLIGNNPSKLNIGGSFSAAGTGTFNISANAGNNQVLMEAASGIPAATMFDLNMPGFTASLAQGTNGARQTLLLNAAITDETGIEGVQSEDVKVWIVNDELRIANYEILGTDKVAVYNISGQLILNPQLPKGERSFSTIHSINVSGWANGMYIVKIGRYTGKVIKK